MLKDYLKDNNLIITDNKYKKRIIEEINSYNILVQYKILSKSEFLNNYIFDYDKSTVKYLVENKKLSVEVAIEYLNILLYLEDKDYKNKKLNYLVELRKELKENNLLITNPLFKEYLKNTNIVIYKCELDPFYSKILANYNLNIIKEEVKSKKINLYEFNDIEDEISYVVYDIKKKLDSGVDINNIKIINKGTEYDNVLTRIFRWSNIPIDFPNRIRLYDLVICKDIISMLKENIGLEEIINSIKVDDKNVFNKIINILNDYVSIGINIEMIIYDFKNTYITDKHLSNAVSIIDISDIDNSSINYLIGFNKENYPKVYKDEDVISDSLKRLLGLFTSNDKNIREANNLLNTLYNNDLFISYKLKDAFNNYNKPLLIDESNINIVNDLKIEYNFSNTYNKEKLGMEYDKYYKYGIISDELLLLKENYSDLNYNSYDNRFTGINKNSYLNTFDKLKISYSSIDNYFRCGFRYYLSNVLNIHDSSDEFYMNIGSIFHYVLSKYRDSDFDFDKYWNMEASKYEFTLDKLIFLENLKQELKYDIEIIKKQENLTSMKNFMFEKRLTIPIKNNLGKNINFTGVVDKIIYDKKDDKTLVSIVDYKTGTLHTDISNMIYGIGMQLPIYLYLVKKSNLFPNSIIVGFYLQKIINKDMKETLNKSIDELKENALKLVGYSNYSDEVIKEFDSSYKDSSLIQGLKCKTDGDFYSYSKVLNNDNVDNIEKIVSNTIDQGVSEILEAKFDINPKRVDKENLGCSYCTFKDICFMKENDIIDYPKKDISSYLGGDTNA